MKCYWCGHRNGSHNDACHEHPGNANFSALLKEIWDRGYADGRAGKDQASQDNAYWLGYHTGEIAYEAHMNGGC